MSADGCTQCYLQNMLAGKKSNLYLIKPLCHTTNLWERKGQDNFLSNAKEIPIAKPTSEKLYRKNLNK
jgi:hypothetical protein